MTDSAPAPAPEKLLDLKCPKSGDQVRDMGSYFWFPGFPRTYCLKILAQREMSAEDFALILSGKSPVFKGFKGNSGKDFSAELKFDEEGQKLDFHFPPMNPLDVMCPKSGEPIDDRGKLYNFPGYPGVAFWKTVSQRTMSVEDYILILEEPEPVEFHNFTSKQGKPFSAPMQYDEEEKKVTFVFADKPKSPKPKAKTKTKAKTAKPATDDPFGGDY
jgi:hypothetical protein